MVIKITPLGAGQDVGRSCLLVNFSSTNRTVILDCGLHMGFDNEKRYPDFSLVLGRKLTPRPTDAVTHGLGLEKMLSAKRVKLEDDGDWLAQKDSLTRIVDCVLITHFHLDHVGSLPYLTETVGYDGPVYMSYPTKAIAPILLEDNRKIHIKNQKTEAKTQPPPYTQEDIRACMSRAIGLNVHEQVSVQSDLEIKTYYAGHVLGAVMFWIKSGDETLVYTGDYNMTPDRHLGAAWIDRCCPDVLITESTYATMVRDSRRTREHEFLHNVQQTVTQGGKVLIPVFALGRAQELCILIDSFFDQTGLGAKVPVYFAGGITSAGNEYFKLFIQWTNEKIKQTYLAHNPFDFKHIRPFEMAQADMPGPMVLFASPGMLSQGLSFEVFKKWCGDPKNMIIMPGYCSPGTPGARLLQGERSIPLPRGPPLAVNMQVENLSFSAHADAKGIMQLCRMSGAKHVVLVHGEAAKMAQLSSRIENELQVPCSFPANEETATIINKPRVSVALSKALYSRGVAAEQSKKRREICRAATGGDTHALLQQVPGPITHVELDGLLVIKSPQHSKGSKKASDTLREDDFPGDAALISNDEVSKYLGVSRFSVIS